MFDFIFLVWDFYSDIFGLLNNTYIRYGWYADDVVSLGSVLFSALVIGFVVSLFWKGARAQ